jgi:hypothetical protein
MCAKNAWQDDHGERCCCFRLFLHTTHQDCVASWWEEELIFNSLGTASRYEKSWPMWSSVHFHKKSWLQSSGQRYVPFCSTMLCCLQEGRIPLLFMYCGNPFKTFLRQINKRLSPLKNQDTIECGHVELDGIKPHGISLKIDNRNS